LCPDCRKERRKEMRESRPTSEGWQRRHDWRWWREWMRKEEDEKKGRMLRQRDSREQSGSSERTWTVGRVDRRFNRVGCRYENPN
jgi:hypothetical protein